MVVLKLILQSGPSSVRELHRLLAKEMSTSYSTVVRTLATMVEAGMVTRDETTRPNRFVAAYDEPVKSQLLMILSNMNAPVDDGIAVALGHDVVEYELPAPRNIVAKVKRQSGFLADLVCLPPTEVVSRLRSEYRFEPFPHLTKLAKTILDLPLPCLSAHGDHFWLTFNRSDRPVSIAGRSHIPQSLYDKFPLQAVPGLEEFLRHFGGMATESLPPCSFFQRPSKCVCVSADDENLEWGVIGDWAGSLSFFQGATGDQIVIHPDGRPGAWFHDVAWEHSGEVAFQPIGMSFPKLIDYLAEYLVLPVTSSQRESSPFYY
jgi:Fe2+ or Zn2+ uptake regulation protein